MNWLERAFHRLRSWTGLADASESHLTPEHGWLLATPADARQQRADRMADRGDRGIPQAADASAAASPGPPPGVSSAERGPDLP